MKINTFTPSININRDLYENINYIPTPNAQLVYSQIISNYQKGSRSFNLIGAYGTGKSSFIIALEQSLKSQSTYFDKAKLFDDISDFDFVNLIGETDSLIDTFSDYFNIVDDNLSPKVLIKVIDKYYQKKAKENKALVIVIDEFGKFLEYVAKNNPERELYFIQQFAEYVNDRSKEILFITILHQNFNAYSLDLSESQFNEWTKVKGRLVELNFNEPVEQLIYLAAERISKEGIQGIDKSKVNSAYEVINKSKLLSLKDYNSIEFSEKLFPFDFLSISVLTLSLQEYAQNERSLFSFIENNDFLSLNDYNESTNPFYNISCVYDYLIYYYYSFLSTKYNPHLNQWNAIKNSIERAESVLEGKINEASKILKTIGLLNIFSNKGGSIDDAFICNYAKICLGISNSEIILNDLISHKILKYSKYDNRYKIFEGTDLDIELEIDKAGNLVEKIKDVTLHLNRYFDFPAIPAKEISYRKGTSRFFTFLLSEDPIIKQPEDEVDGFINLIFNEYLNNDTVKHFSSNCEEAILFGLYHNTDEIKDTIHNIEKVKKVIERNIDDLVAKKELDKIQDHYKKLLNHFVIDSLYSENENIKWFFKGSEININSRKKFNSILSQICDNVYPNTPVFQNEMVNKTKISSTISFARKSLLERILTNYSESDFGYETDKFPPDKSIYLSLLKATGIHRMVGDNYIITEPIDQSFNALWAFCQSFVAKSKGGKLSVIELVSQLKSKPIKLKQGFIDFWIPIFLVANRNEYALYGRLDEYIPDLNQDILELINKSPKDYYIKAFDLTPKKVELFNKYREILDQIEEEKPTIQSFIETIKPFLTFIRNIPEFSKQTKRLSPKALKLRSAILEANDPEKAFFIDFPSALGYNNVDFEKDNEKLEDFAISLKETIQEINSVYEKLINEIEKYLNKEVFGEDIGFPENKALLQKRYKKLKKEALSPKFRVFYQRIVTLLDDRKSWINSLAQACIGNNLDHFKDDDIDKLKFHLINNIRELDNLSDILEQDIDSEKEELIKLEISSLAKGLSKKYVRIPLSKMKDLANLEKSIKEQLNQNDQALNIALLTKLLQEQLKNDK
jgi:hypothetical protein